MLQPTDSETLSNKEGPGGSEAQIYSGRGNRGDWEQAGMGT